MTKRKSSHSEEEEVHERHVQSKHHADGHKKSNHGTSSRASELGRRQHPSGLSRRKNGALQGSEQDIRQNESGEGSRKIAKLMEALHDVLQLGLVNKQQVLRDLGQDALSQCRTLQTALEKRSNPGLLQINPSPMASTSIAPPNTFSDQPLSHIPPPSSLTPWTLSSITLDLPPLPIINSPALETAAFTHSGVTSNVSVLSYERLEWIGDAYLYLISTLLISSTFHTHLPGKCAQIRELLVKNETLASYARAYNFEQRARLPPEFSEYMQSGYRAKYAEKVKVLGDIFEAYVAAVVLSDPEHGVDRVSSWLKSLWAQTISKQITEQERLNERSKSRGSRNDDNSNHPLNSKDILSKRIGAKGVKLHYKDAGPETKDATTGFPVFTVGVYLDGWGEHDKQLGIGKALGKKEAGMRAAEMAMGDAKMMAVYEEKKRIHDEDMRAEKARLALEAAAQQSSAD